MAGDCFRAVAHADLFKAAFEPFFRGNPGRLPSIPGAGLGLAIAKEIIERPEPAYRRRPPGWRLRFRREQCSLALGFEKLFPRGGTMQDGFAAQQLVQK